MCIRDSLQALDNELATITHLSRGSFPNHEDANVFLAFKDVPDRQKCPNIFYWYQNLSMFNPVVIQAWANKTHSPAQQPEQQQSLQQQSKEGAADDFDPFADDNEEDEAEAKKLAQKKKDEAKSKPKKEKEVIAKSMVIFEVKVYEQEQNLDDLAKKLLQYQQDGLHWRTEYQKVDIAYGMQKLQIGATVEDAKVSVDDLFDYFKEQQYPEEIQSIDIVSFQKV
eukprot:TRINITY_DN8367_c0_g1_i14.p1 TRINITY_DN8367_c0_g1~~TRINITY_DN8367_c0_g1_i14.p1  ORF type:complete len:224 (-),score=69.74 TRINITY_DN8367_c0_g1_i14:125-796(-)